MILTILQFAVISLLLIECTKGIDYAANRDDIVPKDVSRSTTESIRTILEKQTLKQSRHSLQEATEHVLYYSALLRLDILDTLGKIIFYHYDEFRIYEVEALFQLYQETLKRKYSILDIVPSVLSSGDTRLAVICSYIRKQVRTCLKESLSICMKLKIPDRLNARANRSGSLIATQKLYTESQLMDHYRHGFNLSGLFSALKSNQIIFSKDLFLGLLFNIQFDKVDNRISTAEKEITYYLTSYPESFMSTILISQKSLRESSSMSIFLRDFLLTVNFPLIIRRRAKFLAGHIITEISTLNANIQHLGTIYENGTIDLEYLFRLILPDDIIEDDVKDARDYLVLELKKQKIVQQYLNIDKYLQSEPEQLLMELLWQLERINFAHDIVKVLRIHARYWHSSHMIQNINDLVELFDSFENLRKLPLYKNFMDTMDVIKSYLQNLINVSIEMPCSNPRNCLRIGLEIIQQCHQTPNYIRAYIHKLLSAAKCRRYEDIGSIPVRQEAVFLKPLIGTHQNNSYNMSNDKIGRTMEHTTPQQVKVSSNLLPLIRNDNIDNKREVSRQSDNPYTGQLKYPIKSNSIPPYLSTKSNSFVAPKKNLTPKILSTTKNPRDECKNDEACNENEVAPIGPHFTTINPKVSFTTKPVSYDGAMSQKPRVTTAPISDDDSDYSDDSSCEECKAAESYTTAESFPNLSTHTVKATNFIRKNPVGTEGSRIQSTLVPRFQHTSTKPSEKLGKVLTKQMPRLPNPVRRSCEHHDLYYRRQQSKLSKMRKFNAFNVSSALRNNRYINGKITDSIRTSEVNARRQLGSKNVGLSYKSDEDQRRVLYDQRSHRSGSEGKNYGGSNSQTQIQSRNTVINSRSHSQQQSRLKPDYLTASKNIDLARSQEVRAKNDVMKSLNSFNYHSRGSQNTDTMRKFHEGQKNNPSGEISQKLKFSDFHKLSIGSVKTGGNEARLNRGKILEIKGPETMNMVISSKQHHYPAEQNSDAVKNKNLWYQVRNKPESAEYIRSSHLAQRKFMKTGNQGERHVNVPNIISSGSGKHKTIKLNNWITGERSHQINNQVLIRNEKLQDNAQLLHYSKPMSVHSHLQAVKKTHIPQRKTLRFNSKKVLDNLSSVERSTYNTESQNINKFKGIGNQVNLIHLENKLKSSNNLKSLHGHGRIKVASTIENRPKGIYNSLENMQHIIRFNQTMNKASSAEGMNPKLYAQSKRISKDLHQIVNGPSTGVGREEMHRMEPRGYSKYLVALNPHSQAKHREYQEIRASQNDYQLPYTDDGLQKNIQNKVTKGAIRHSALSKYELLPQIKNQADNYHRKEVLKSKGEAQFFNDRFQGDQKQLITHERTAGQYQSVKTNPLTKFYDHDINKDKISKWEWKSHEKNYPRMIRIQSFKKDLIRSDEREAEVNNHQRQGRRKELDLSGNQSSFMNNAVKNLTGANSSRFLNTGLDKSDKIRTKELEYVRKIDELPREIHFNDNNNNNSTELKNRMLDVYMPFLNFLDRVSGDKTIKTRSKKDVDAE